MTKNILHAIKKLLRIGIVAVTVTSGSINASAHGGHSNLCSASCNSQLNISLDGSGYALIDPAIISEGVYSESCIPLLDQVVLEIEGANPVYLDVTQNGYTVETTSALLNCSFRGKNVAYNLIKYYSNGETNSCVGNILIEDKMKPNVVYSDLTINCTENTDPYILASTSKNSIPVATDNCGISTLTYLDSEEDYNCLNPEFLKKIIRVWTTSDKSGNEQTFIQNIFIKKTDGEIIQFPGNLKTPKLISSSTDLTPINTGYPTLYGVNISNQNLSNFSSNYQDQLIKTSEGDTQILRNWTVVDWCTNEIFSQSQIIKVELNKKTD